ncbi:MAG: protein kinase [Proteobacteria bacterium]|nr:protein kinase [Pseudomonadota bacterium]
MSAGRPNKPSLPLQAALGPYFIERLIASGGMAEIYLARMRGLAGFEKQVALKVILPELARDAAFTRMLVAEAKIAVGLTHAHILKIFDLGLIEGTYLIAMEYVDGSDFFQLLCRCTAQQRALPAAAALFVVHAVATGLAYAHGPGAPLGQPPGVIHRDISPQNILLSRYGEVKIADFGIAKVVNITSQTRVGALKGKLGYMSPEQAWGEKVDSRSDIFSSGVVLYEALTGRSLYLESDPVKLLQQVRRAEIPAPSAAQPALGPDFDTLVLKALAREPGQRYQTAGEFAAAIAEVLHRRDPHFVARQLGDLVNAVLADEAPSTTAPARRRSEARTAEPMKREDFVTHEHSLISGDQRAVVPAPARGAAEEVAHATTAPRRGRVWARLQLVQPESGEHSVVLADEFVIGRGGELGLTDGRVSRRHARVWRRDAGYWLEDLKSANGTFLNLQRVDAPGALQSGDVVRVGPYELRFTLEPDRSAREPASAAGRSPAPRVTIQEAARPAEGASPESARAPRVAAPTVALLQQARLVVELGGQTLQVEVGEALALDHQLTLGPRMIAGTAARIARGGNGFTIDPGRGVAGTLLLNGQPLREPQPLSAGDKLTVGPLLAVVELS